MTDKLTDKDIIKALPNMTYGGHYCAKCKYDNGKGNDRCGLKGCKIARYALDLINRQQAELERLTKETMNMAINIETCQGEAITEFAERLKEGAQMADCFDSYNMVVGTHFIDDLLKEMVDE